MFQVDENDPVGELEPSFPYRDVTIKRNVDMKDFFELQTEIGRGKFGTVYRVREKQTGLQLAAKFVATPKREDRRNVEREVDIMRSLQHPRLIQLYDAFDYNNVMCVVLELIEGGELFERVIDDDFVLTEKACTVFMRQICEGVDFIHQQNILHLDLKPENILCLTRTGNRIKIIDFGLARRYDSTKKLQVLFGTPEFVAPEIVNFEQIGFGTDMWSVGVICYVLLSGLSPFMGETDVETMANVTIAKYDFDDEVFNDVSEDAKEFIQQLLLKDKDARLGARACLTQPWLRRRPAAPPPSEPVAVEEQLATAQDNLRVFVARWTEHPDSPYAAVSTPSPVPARPRSSSLSANSPSPCGSLSSSPDSSLPDNSQFPPHLFTNFERRASDSSCILSPTADTATRVSLADEIRKLSDKLFQMATLHSADEPIRPPAFLTKYSNPNHDEQQQQQQQPKLKKSNKLSIHSRDVVSGGSPPPDTKDLLLHLLDRWEDTSPPTEQCSGRKSFSIEWAREDSRTIGQRSMTSLASYFQATSQNVQKKRTIFQSQFGV